MSTIRTTLLRVLRVVRDAWLIVGITLGLIIVLEIAWRAAAFAAGSLARGPVAGPASPFDTVSWAGDYARDVSRESSLLWEPYVYLRNPSFEGRAISVDSSGHRRTFTPPLGSKPLELWVLGGSAAFGWNQRDAFTIPSVLARELAGKDVHVTNLAVPGFVFTQELIALELRLRAGARPDIVLFYDGVNDAFATVQAGVAGIPENEANRAADFAAGRERARDSLLGIPTDLRVARHAAANIAGRLRLLAPLRRTGGAQTARTISADSATRGIVRVYLANVRMVEALGRAWGFTPLYAWQPSLLSSAKVRTPYERWVAATFDDAPNAMLYRDIMRGVPAVLREPMASLASGRFVDLTDLFRGDTASVFLDAYGHTVEGANVEVVAALRPFIEGAAAHSRRGEMP